MSATSTAAARAVSTAGSSPYSRYRREQHRHGSHEHQQAHAPEHPGHVLLERRPVRTECPGTGRQLVGEGPGTDPGRHVPRLAIDAEAARQHLGADHLGDPVRLAREQRLVGLEGARGRPCRRAAAGRRDGPRAGRPRTTSVGSRVISHAVPDDGRRRSGEHRQAVEAALGADLLEQPHDDVDQHQHDGHGRVAVQAERRPGRRR